jgi:ABC-type branched-subunit amino acid transport system ATPase component
MATMADLDELALAMPQATKEVSDDGRPTYLVHGKFFCFHRSRRRDAIDAKTGERLDDVLMFRVADLGVKELMLADEPVASLDPATSHSVMKYLEEINKKDGITVICSLHFLSLARRYGTRVIALKAGKVAFDGKPADIDERRFKEIYGEDAVEVEIGLGREAQGMTAKQAEMESLAADAEHMER